MTAFLLKSLALASRTRMLVASIAGGMLAVPANFVAAQPASPNSGIVPPHLVAGARGTAVAEPDATPPEISEHLQKQPNATTSASSSGQQSSSKLPGESAYIYSTLRVINNFASRGCAAGDWNCMTNLCKADLGSDAWRGWSGCDTYDEGYICFFECDQVKKAF